MALDKERTELDREKEKFETNQAKSPPAGSRFAKGALAVMVVQIVAANAACFVWYGDTNGWDIPAAAISTWLGSTVAQVVAVVLVIMNYLFPKSGPKD